MEQGKIDKIQSILSKNGYQSKEYAGALLPKATDTNSFHLTVDLEDEEINIINADNLLIKDDPEDIHFSFSLDEAEGVVASLIKAVQTGKEIESYLKVEKRKG